MGCPAGCHPRQLPLGDLAHGSGDEGRLRASSDPCGPVEQRAELRPNLRPLDGQRRARVLAWGVRRGAPWGAGFRHGGLWWFSAGDGKGGRLSRASVGCALGCKAGCPGPMWVARWGPVRGAPTS